MKLNALFAAPGRRERFRRSQAAQAAGEVVGVSWSNFQEERWKKDEAAIKAALDAAGAKYIAPTRRAPTRSSSPTSRR